jgi:hypothetical protein
MHYVPYFIQLEKLCRNETEQYKNCKRILTSVVAFVSSNMRNAANYSKFVREPDGAIHLKRCGRASFPSSPTFL